jgi:heme/copper-type cytochrome/quinol oxidase subunit 3
MKRKLRLPTLIGEALLIFAAGYFGLDLLAGGVFLGSDIRRDLPIAAIMTAILVPVCAATWWLFRKLRQTYSRREAGTAAITFGVFSPISLLVATPFATLPGNLAAGLLGSSFGLVGAFLGLVVMTGALILIPMVLALMVARRFKTTAESERGGPQ